MASWKAWRKVGLEASSSGLRAVNETHRCFPSLRTGKPTRSARFRRGSAADMPVGLCRAGRPVRLPLRFLPAREGEAAPGDDPPHPGGEALGTAQRPQPLPGVDEGVLHHVLGGLVAGQHAARQGHQLTPEALHEVAEGFAIAAAGAEHELGDLGRIASWGCHGLGARRHCE